MYFPKGLAKELPKMGCVGSVWGFGGWGLGKKYTFPIHILAVLTHPACRQDGKQIAHIGKLVCLPVQEPCATCHLPHAKVYFQAIKIKADPF